MRILIVEDEPIIARRIARLTRSILDDANLIIEAAEGLDSAQDALLERDIDLLFLDLNLHGADGFDLLTTSVAGAFHTIVISAYTDRAIEAFEFGVLDFIGKPFGRERLAQALQRLHAPGARTDPPARYLAVRASGRVTLIDVERVLALQGAGSYSELVLRDGSTTLHDKPLKRLVTLLPDDFVRIHRSYVVRMSAVAHFLAREGSRYAVELHDGTTLPVGRTRVDAVRERLV
ncbi:MAG: response regulator [Bacteroidetes bacterium]|jgi:two-component system response regulator LytT|nr:response regulator [Bacteroidota bacterium]